MLIETLAHTLASYVNLTEQMNDMVFNAGLIHQVSWLQFWTDRFLQVHSYVVFVQ